MTNAIKNWHRITDFQCFCKTITGNRLPEKELYFSLQYMMPGQFVRVYSGLGCSERSLHMLLKSLQQLFTRYTVETISPADIIQGLWERDTALLAIGGGFDRGFVKALGRRGVANIRQYVHEGGSYLGICAGGYFGCEYVQFDKGGPLEVCGTRDLKFFPGKCIGPSFPGFQYDSEEGAHAATIHWLNAATEQPMNNSLDQQATPNSLQQSVGETNHAHTTASVSLSDQTFTCYFNGGGHFWSGEPLLSSRCVPLAVYANLPNAPPAVVQCWSGLGKAVLTGIHMEYIWEDLDDKNQRIEHILPRLRAGQKQCDKYFKTILELLGLEISMNMKANL